MTPSQPIARPEKQAERIQENDQKEYDRQRLSLEEAGESLDWKAHEKNCEN
jgi:hypothetical protein